MSLSLFNSLSGLIAFSRGLDVISDNVSNLDTPGHKGNDLLFRDLLSRYEVTARSGDGSTATRMGSGVRAAATTTRFSQGELQNTGNDTDLAIQGNGLFILERDGVLFYTRVGQFAFDEDDFLISRDLDARVKALDESGNLIDISISGFRTNPAKATGEVKFANNLSSEADRFEIRNVELVDVLGTSHFVTVTFTRNQEGEERSWFVDVQDEDGASITSGNEIRFQGNGSPLDGFNTFTFTFDPEGAGGSEVTFNFGDPGSFIGTTSFATGNVSNVVAQSQDGRQAGSLLGVSFDEQGVMSLTYSNGETVERERIALAWFDDLQSLRLLGAGLFTPAEGQTPRLASPMEDVMGEIVGESIELSNIDLSREFTDLIIVQRGFQASSQVLSTTNEMIQQLLDMQQRR